MLALTVILSRKILAQFLGWQLDPLEEGGQRNASSTANPASGLLRGLRDEGKCFAGASPVRLWVLLLRIVPGMPGRVSSMSSLPVSWKLSWNGKESVNTSSPGLSS